MVAAAVTAYLGKRAKSGRINTTEAEELWATMRSELARLQGEAVEYRAEIAVSRQEMNALREEALTVRVRMTELEARLVACAKLEKTLRAKLRRAGVATA